MDDTKKHKKPIGWRRWDVLAASFALNILALAMPLVILQVYDRILPNQAESTFIFLIISLVVVLILELFLRVLRSMLMSWEAAKYDHKESMRAIHHILYADNQAVEKHSSGFFLDRVQALDKVQEFYSGQAMLLVMDFPFIITFLVVIWIIAGNLVLVPLVLLGLFLIISLYAGNQLHSAIKLRSEMEERRQNFLIEILQGIHTVKSMAMESFMLRRYERLQGQSADAIYKLASINSLVEGAGASFSQLAVITFVGFGAGYAIAGELSIGALAAGTMLSGRVLQPGIRAMSVWSQFQSVRYAKKQVDELFEVPLEANGDTLIEKGLQGRIELKNISFAYPGSEHLVLNNASLVVNPGESIAISGKNGTGKSTLIKLIAGFLTPNEGEILLDNKPLSNYHLQSLRSKIAVMPQQGLLFEGTILENMTLYREGSAIDEAVKLSCMIGLNKIISKFPQGLDTPITGAGLNSLPEGVKQKIIIIRSLIGNPNLILFDDANANLDLKNDQILLSLIKQLKGKKTMIIVTHRPTYMRVCDRQYEIQHGQLMDVSNQFNKPALHPKTTQTPAATPHRQKEKTLWPS